MSSNHNTLILERIAELEQEQNVKVIFACEAGSRAWGFPSADSDYDVRFVYVHTGGFDHYVSLNIETQRDTITWFSQDRVLDFCGWDVRKVLKLMCQSNPSLVEWFRSPVVYVSVEPFASMLRAFLTDTYSPVSAHYHYLSMAKNNNGRFLQGELVLAKKYLYVIRPLVAVLYIGKHPDAPPPIDFRAMLSDLQNFDIVEKVFLEKLHDLMLLKQTGTEKEQWVPRDQVLDDFIASFLGGTQQLQLRTEQLRTEQLRTEQLRTEQLRTVPLPASTRTRSKETNADMYKRADELFRLILVNVVNK